MEMEKAARLLAKKLVETSGRRVVFDESHKDKLVRNSDFAYVVGDSKIIDYQKDYKKYFSQGSTNKMSIEEALQGIIPEEANYLFASDPVQWGDNHLGMNVVPYTIIGKDERSVIKERFYKGDNLEVREAVESLGIENFFLLYNIYSTKKFLKFYNLLDVLSENRFFAEALAKKEHKHVDKLEEFIQGQEHLDNLNYLIRMLGPSRGAFAMNDNVCSDEFSILMKHMGDYSDFFNFVFNIPLEDRDLETNKQLLKRHSSSLSIDTILLKEYVQGNSFIEYFKALDKPLKENVVNVLEGHKPVNDSYNSFLFEQGFKEVMNLSDYSFWYKNDYAGKFIDAFKAEGREKKI
ncbi:hypothetical protein FJZ53_03535, partial [Candidatus Woesearchaeota archaeon]|nr:hypothetical protein [Candidatus Woesearchaeota archaeon]